MRRTMRGVALALATTATGLLTGTASAAINPDPYAFGAADTGTLVATSSTWGRGTCNVGGLAGTLNGNANGASGSITALTYSGCTGILGQATSSLVRAAAPIDVSVDRGSVTLYDYRVRIRFLTFGTCLHGGSLNGTIANGATTISGSNAELPLISSIEGICGRLDVTLRINTGARTSW